MWTGSWEVKSYGCHTPEGDCKDLRLSTATKSSGGGGGGDWLGLGGDDDGGLDLSNAPLKSSTPLPNESKKDTPSTQGMLVIHSVSVRCCP